MESSQSAEADVQRLLATSQRELAERQLHQSLVNESRFLRTSKLQGWRSLSLDGLARAGDLKAADANLASLRSELLETLSQIVFSVVPLMNAPRQSTVRSLDFSPDGGWTMWDTSTWTELVNVGHNQSRGLTNALQPIRSIAFSPDDRHLALARDNEEFEIWDLKQAFESLKHTGIAPTKIKRLLSSEPWPTQPIPKLVRGKPPAETVDPASDIAVELAMQLIEDAVADGDPPESLYPLDRGLMQLHQSRTRRSESELFLLDITQLMDSVSHPNLRLVIEAHLASAQFETGNKERPLEMFKALAQRAKKRQLSEASTPSDHFASMISMNLELRCTNNHSLRKSFIDDLISVAVAFKHESLVDWMSEQIPPSIYAIYRHDSDSGVKASDQWTVALASLSTDPLAPDIQRLAKSASQRPFTTPRSLYLSRARSWSKYRGPLHTTRSISFEVAFFS